MNSTRASILMIATLLVGVTLSLWVVGRGVDSPLRHLFFLPVLWGAMRFGLRGGVLAALLAVLFYAPVVIPAVELLGPTPAVGEGLMTFVLLLGAGGLAGRLADQAEVESSRYRGLSELQRALSGAGELPELLERAAKSLRKNQSAHAILLVLMLPEAERVILLVGTDDAPRWVRNERAVFEGSPLGWVIGQKQVLYIPDLGSDSRLSRPPSWTPFPRRLLLIPLTVAHECIGLLGIERHGEFRREERASAGAMGLEIALGIEHARLTLRQRRFAEELEAKVAAATQNLRELDQAKSDFVSMTSHELRTPLTSIQGFTEILLTRELSRDRAGEFLRHIHHESIRLGRIVSDLLDLSRIELGRGVELHRTAVELAALLERNASLFQQEASGHQISWRAEPQLPPVFADPEKLDQIVQNLLSNAVKYSPAGGAIRLWAGLSDASGMAEISVSDEGVGIPLWEIPRIFEKYYRVENPGAGQARGLGLGLALVKALVEAHEGAIRVESRVGEGSRFIVALPLYHAPPGAGEPRATHKGATGSDLKFS